MIREGRHYNEPTAWLQSQSTRARVGYQVGDNSFNPVEGRTFGDSRHLLKDSHRKGLEALEKVWQQNYHCVKSGLENGLEFDSILENLSPIS